MLGMCSTTELYPQALERGFQYETFSALLLILNYDGSQFKTGVELAISVNIFGGEVLCSF